mmetsp:Transcript_21051/g.54469  ORF Transcript_21051/g.54469 Transcript_21051/m.54469 type:complete len:291 (+) Transcript_21051:7793-8665(+)
MRKTRPLSEPWPRSCVSHPSTWTGNACGWARRCSQRCRSCKRMKIIFLRSPVACGTATATGGGKKRKQQSLSLFHLPPLSSPLPFPLPLLLSPLSPPPPTPTNPFRLLEMSLPFSQKKGRRPPPFPFVPMPFPSSPPPFFPRKPAVQAGESRRKPLWAIPRVVQRYHLRVPPRFRLPLTDKNEGGYPHKEDRDPKGEGWWHAPLCLEKGGPPCSTDRDPRTTGSILGQGRTKGRGRTPCKTSGSPRVEDGKETTRSGNTSISIACPASRNSTEEKSARGFSCGWTNYNPS